MRRSLALLVIATATLVPACGRAPDAPDCRQDFSDYHATMSGYGNPGIDSLPVLTARWDSLHDAFGRLGRTARTSDCDDFDRLTETVQSVELVLVTADDFDMRTRLATVEEDLADLQSSGRYDPPPASAVSAIETLRIAGPLVDADLAPQLGALDRTDPLDADGVAAAEAALRSAAEANDQYRDCIDALQVLSSYELGDYDETKDPA